MRNHLATLALLLAMVFALGACTKNDKVALPDTTPDKVVMKFFDLLSDGGKLSNREALNMVSDRHGAISPDNFRRWTENYSNKTKLNIIKTILPESPNDDGEWIAQVDMTVSAPSMFGGDFTTSSKLNLILDEKDKAWKIDFLAETVNEDHYRSLPAEARAEP